MRQARKPSSPAEKERGGPTPPPSPDPARARARAPVAVWCVGSPLPGPGLLFLPSPPGCVAGRPPGYFLLMGSPRGRTLPRLESARACEIDLYGGAPICMRFSCVAHVSAPWVARVSLSICPRV
ncbi:unnamed protein product [Amoebophrya sp. A120]|nr:unnamed protein product [Amoebophrya sp. A120]|eukprot:GSA120T00015845001.1